MFKKLIFILTIIYFLISSQSFFSFPRFFGYKVGVGPCKISQGNPIITILSYQGTDYFAGASWINGKWYAVTHLTRNLITCDTGSGQNTLIGNIGNISGDPVAMCWDPTSNITYMLTTSPNKLYAVNLSNGSTAFVANITPFTQHTILTGAFSFSGSLFSIIDTIINNNTIDKFIRINKTTGIAQQDGANVIGAVLPQSMTFTIEDVPAPGLIWAFYGPFPYAGSFLIDVDTNNFSTITLLALPDSTEITGLIIPDNYSGVEKEGNKIPSGFKLEQNYPNPFNPSTQINFSIPKRAYVKIIIYDILGRIVDELVNSELEAGTYSADWPAASGNEANFSSGVYFYRMVAGNYNETKRMILMK